jgi:Histidine kinase-, DNA gyrase B-, and HSP90-like ATPase
MWQQKESDIIELDHFIQATRDSGYKGTAAALAELIDNSYEAGATRVDVEVRRSGDGEPNLVVADNGCGMLPSVLRRALRFGGSTRFNSRKGMGRYGMGLPNSSLSHARRVDVYTWTKSNAVWWSYLDVDEIVARRMNAVPVPRRVKIESERKINRSPSGTVVVWSKCDRLDYKYEKALITRLRKTLGQVFRFQLWEGKALCINGTPVLPVDPLFLRNGNNLTGASPYGPPLKYEIRFGLPGGRSRASMVLVTFTELPIKKWHRYSNEEKRSYGITKSAGVSIVRSGREIDYGWFFMGKKRKENYDDWWRCEIQFSPELDELFGVTNTKQGIHPTDALKGMLTPDIERTAHDLNSRVRKRYLQVKSDTFESPAKHQAEDRDHLLEPPARAFMGGDKFSAYGVSHSPKVLRGRKRAVPGLAYRVEHKTLEDESFFIPLISSRELVVILNEEHPFYERVYLPIAKNTTDGNTRQLYRYLELMLFAVARAECSIPSSDGQAWARSMREAWSQALATFLE